MITAIVASVALLSTTVLAGPGSAIVINKCSYPVSLQNTPASGGGYSIIPETLAAGGGSYSQVYTPLSNSDGWSLKLSQPNNPSNILQYEYTYHGDNTIWFDLSEVNGNPWDGNWEITANNGCTPRQAAYRYSTDDAYGMQACDSSASVTVTLCSGTSSGGSQGPAPSSPQETSWAATPSAAAPTSEAPTSAAPAPTNTWGGHSWGVEGNKVESPAGNALEDKKAPTTLATTYNGPAVTVTNLAFETVTQIVTATHHAHKRHARHAHHQRI